MKITQQYVPLNILLADDDIDDRSFFEKAISEMPMPAILKTFNNGEQLMDYLAENATNLPDMLFLDLSMPRKTGFECLAEIKESIILKNIPVVMLTTSYTRGLDLEDNLKTTLLRMGAYDYIRKPIDFEELKTVVHQTLARLTQRQAQQKANL